MVRSTYTPRDLASAKSTMYSFTKFTGININISCLADLMTKCTILIMLFQPSIVEYTGSIEPIWVINADSIMDVTCSVLSINDLTLFLTNLFKFSLGGLSTYVLGFVAKDNTNPNFSNSLRPLYIKLLDNPVCLIKSSTVPFPPSLIKPMYILEYILLIPNSSNSSSISLSKLEDTLSHFVLL